MEQTSVQDGTAEETLPETVASGAEILIEERAAAGLLKAKSVTESAADVADTAEEAAEEIKRRAAEGNDSQTLAFSQFLVEEICGEGSYDGKGLTLQLARLKEHGQEPIPKMAVESRLPGVGLLKRLFGKVAAAVLLPVFQHQNQYNMELASALWEMKVEMDKRERLLLDRIEQVERENEMLKRRCLQREE